MDNPFLFELLTTNQLGELFNALKNGQPYNKDLILLESKWNDLRAKQRNDLISHEQANIELAQIRNGLLQLIESRDGQRVTFAAAPPAATPAARTWIWVVAACVGLVVLFGIYRFATQPAADNAAMTDPGRNTSTSATSGKAAASARPLNVSEALPVTMSAGDFQYERVYSVVKTKVESTGGGKSLITLTVGLDFKGIINDILSSDNFRLFADELPGPLAPANFLSVLVNSRSYGEGDVKFELSDEIKRFTIVIEGKEDKKWVFSR